MQILIVDDNENRSERIKNYLVSKKIASESIHITTCVDHAKNILRTNYFDILILDVVLPKRQKESAYYKHGLDLLEQLARTTKYKKPEKIIGITGFLSDISKFKTEFEKYCFNILEAKNYTGEWLETLFLAIYYSNSSQLARVNSESNLHIITIHGIRTFGDWQGRFKKLIKARIDGVNVSSYKYGYLTLISYLIPPLRDIQIKTLSKKLNSLFDEYPDNQFTIYSHSFGTYLLVHALKNLISNGYKIPVKNIILSGSVLDSNFDWSSLKRACKFRIINDCGIQDNVLLLSKALVFNTGMAGRTGFYGFEDSILINRFFKGGHSHYFKGDDFMEMYWLPLLVNNEVVCEVDERIKMSDSSKTCHGILIKSISFICKIKIIIYLLIAYVIYSSF